MITRPAPAAAGSAGVCVQLRIRSLGLGKF